MKRCAFASLAVVAAVISVSAAIAATTSTETIEKCWKPGMSHDAAMDCEAAELKIVEKQLDNLYAKLHAEAKEWESESPDSVAYQGLNENLSKSEAAFKAFVKAQCGYEVQLYGTGNGAGDAMSLCPIRLISEQLKSLEPTKNPRKN